MGSTLLLGGGLGGGRGREKALDIMAVVDIASGLAGGGLLSCESVTPDLS